ncbi:MAG TPA: PspA/IM30 family protein [Gemmatimonadaceae bacterium]|nr:PspA/IM30 family protein [Gemmatimonadaceae bacterium]
MIFGKIFAAFRAQLNKIANLFFESDPIAVMQLEVDQATERLKEGRKGLEIYRGLVEGVARQVAAGKANAAQLEAQIKSHLKAGNREMAAQLAVQLQKTQNELTQNEGQLQMHEQAYQNNLLKIQKANKDILKIQEKVQKYKAELKMSAAEAEIAQLSESFDMNVTTDFGQIENVIQRQIDTNRGKARVAADMSSKGIEQIKAEEAADKAMAEDLLSKYEVQLGLKSPETTPVAETAKNLGPTVEQK